MISKDTILKVTNRNNGSTGYTVADLGIHRHFSPNESKDITMDELRKLSYVPGGRYIIENCLIIHNEEAVREILTDVEPEYFYTEAEIKQLLTKGSLDQLLDCLDYAPEGVISLVKNMAVDMKLNDVSKRDAIKDKTGFDVSKAIEIKIESEKTDEVVETSSRRAAPIVTKTENEEGAARRTTAPRYNVVVD
jgi:hypothetical protein